MGGGGGSIIHGLSLAVAVGSVGHHTNLSLVSFPANQVNQNYGMDNSMDRVAM